MRSGWRLFSALFQLIVGICGIIAFGIIAFGGEAVGRWIVTLILSIAFAVLGAMELAGWIRNR